MYLEDVLTRKIMPKPMRGLVLAAVHGDSLEVQNRDRAAEKIIGTTFTKAQHRGMTALRSK